MKEKLLTLVLLINIFAGLTPPLTVKAEESQDSLQNITSATTELLIKEINEVDNVPKHEFDSSTYTINPYSTCSQDNGLNDDPNYAYLVNNGDIVQGSITEQYDMRWYASIIDSKTKLSVYLETEDTIDADIYLFLLNQETYELELINGSVNTGLGIVESVIDIVEPGIYYFAISNYYGYGNFGFGYYESTSDVEYEVNDTEDTATPISINTTISAVIDNPNDIDLYTITLDEPTVIRYTLNTPSNLNYQMDYYSGDGGIRIKDNLISLTKGIHTFYVNSINGSCSEGNSYSICLKKIAKAADDSTAVKFACSESKGIVFQFDANRTKFYVNGNLIDFSYSHKKSLSNSAGTQSYNIQLRKTQNINVCVYQTEGTDLSAEIQRGIPKIVRYRSSTLTGITNRDVLMLSVFDETSPCYSIHNVCSGAYKDNTLWKDLNFCNIFVDPNTGKVIDIAWYNYFYEVGSYTLSYSTIGSLNYYYPYYNGIDPE